MMDDIRIENAIYDLGYATKNVEVTHDLMLKEHELLGYYDVLKVSLFRHSEKTVARQAKTAFDIAQRYRPSAGLRGVISGSVEAKFKVYTKMDMKVRWALKIAKRYYKTHPKAIWKKYVKAVDA